MIRFLSIALIAALIALPSLSVQAQDDSSSDTSKPPPTEATKKMKQVLDQPAPVEDGAKQAPGGQTKPVENWFGCEPDESKQEGACDKQKGAEEGGDNKEESDKKTSP